MRLLCTTNESKGLALSHYLKSQGITSSCEIVQIDDWGSDSYGDYCCYLWILEEDQFPKAEQYYEHYLASPDDPKYRLPKESLAPKPKLANKQPIGAVTLWLAISCAFLFAWSSATTQAPALPRSIASIAYLTSSPIHQELLYDFPKSYTLLHQLVELHAAERKALDNSLSKQTSRLFTQYKETPTWDGLYPKLVLALQGGTILWNQPLFERIGKGEIWRALTPSLLHSDLLHLFFNTAWLVTLGRQIEQRLGKGRYLLLIAVAALFSNTLQYLVSGPLFLGLSGVISAMIGFIYMRQQLAGWEGYQLQRATFRFLLFFILAMVAIQLFSFIGQVYWNSSLAPRIANTAHLAGFLIGLIMGRVDYFAWRRGLQ